VPLVFQEDGKGHKSAKSKDSAIDSGNKKTDAKLVSFLSFQFCSRVFYDNSLSENYKIINNLALYG